MLHKYQVGRRLYIDRESEFPGNPVCKMHSSSGICWSSQLPTGLLCVEPGWCSWPLETLCVCWVMGGPRLLLTSSSQLCCLIQSAPSFPPAPSQDSQHVEQLMLSHPTFHTRPNSSQSSQKWTTWPPLLSLVLIFSSPTAFSITAPKSHPIFVGLCWTLAPHSALSPHLLIL